MTCVASATLGASRDLRASVKGGVAQGRRRDGVEEDEDDIGRELRACRNTTGRRRKLSMAAGGGGATGLREVWAGLGPKGRAVGVEG